MGVYNTGRYLRAAIDSVLNQQGVEFEFIIVDDGSTDDSPDILVEATARDARVRVITQATLTNETGLQWTTRTTTLTKHLFQHILLRCRRLQCRLFCFLNTGALLKAYIIRHRRSVCRQ